MNKTTTRAVLLFSLLFISLMNFCVFAENDYSLIRGDFKSFCLKDSKEIAQNKLNYYIRTGDVVEHQVKCDYLFKVRTQGMIADCLLQFYKNQLYMIELRFPISEDTYKSVKDSIFQVERDLNKRYGKPTIDDICTKQKIVWALPTKTIKFSILPLSENTGEVNVSFIDNKLESERNKIKPNSDF